MKPHYCYKHLGGFEGFAVVSTECHVYRYKIVIALLLYGNPTLGFKPSKVDALIPISMHSHALGILLKNFIHYLCM